MSNKRAMWITIKKDWDWFLAEVEGHDNIFAYWETEEKARIELLWVAEMMMDFHLEQVETERQIKNNILNYNTSKNALQV